MATAVKVTPEQALTKFQRVAEELKAYFVGRDDVIDAMLIAAMSGQHFFMQGPPGTAKSALAKAFFSHFSHAKTFSIKMDREKSYSDLFGPINIKRLKEDGVQEHNITGTLADCDFAMIDEVFDMGKHVSRMFLDVLNERELRNGSQNIKVPLKFAVLASNFYKDNEEFEAFSDRLLFRYKIRPVAESQRIHLLRVPRTYTPKTKLRMSDLQAVQRLGRKMPIVDQVIHDMATFVSMFKNSMGSKSTRFQVSDRRMVWVRDVAPFFALYEGKKGIDQDSLYKAYQCFAIHGDMDQDEALREALLRHKKNFGEVWQGKNMEKVNKIKFFTDSWANIISSMEKGKTVSLNGVEAPAIRAILGLGHLYQKFIEDFGEGVEPETLAAMGVLDHETIQRLTAMNRATEFFNEKAADFHDADDQKIKETLETL